MPGKPEEPGPNPQSCDIDYSRSRGWGHQGCLDHSQEGQEGHSQVLGAQEGHPGVIPQFQYHGLSDTFLSKIPIAPCYWQMMG